MKVRRLRVWGFVTAFLGLVSFLIPAAVHGAGAAYVQAAAKAASGTAKTLSLSFPANTKSGDLILVAFDYTSGAAPSSVGDSQGNVFTAVGNQLSSPGGALSRVYYAKNIKGGADTVTVTLTANSSWIELYLTEYTGIDPTNPIDAQAGASGSTSAVSSGNATTKVAGDMIFGYCVGDWNCTAGTGFSARSTLNGNLIEDKVAGAAGSYAATGTANKGWTMQMVALKPASGTVGAPPVITSATTASGTVGSAFSYHITATNSPTSYGASGLPAGLSVNTATGLISGTPTTTGTSAVKVSATNSAGTGNATLTLTINNPAPPVITSATSATGTVGSAFRYQITATNTPTSYGATGLPAGLSVNAATGLISGTPTSTGTSTVKISATNSAGTGNSTLTLTIKNPVPSITSFSPASAVAGSAAQILTIHGTGFGSTSTVTYNSVAHMATFVNSMQLTIQLTAPDQMNAGKFPVVVTNPAPGGGPSTPTNFTVNNPVPTITSLSPASASAGTAAQTLTIHGTNFLSTSTVTYNGAGHAATFVNAMQLTIQLTAGDQAVAGMFPVIVTNPAPGGGSSGPVNFTVTASGTNPVVSLSSTSLPFGFWTLGTTSRIETVTLTNTGNSALTITSVGLTGSNPLDFGQTDTCVGSVGAGSNCTISLTFTPQATGSRTAAVSITDNASGSPQSVSLSATGLNSADQFMVLDPTKKHLVNTLTNQPVFMTGDAPQTLMVQVDNADVMTYLNDRASRGFNALWVYPVDKTDQTNAPENFYGQMPFNGVDFTNENETYWQNVDLVVQEAQAQGITLMMDPGFVGLDSTGGYVQSYLNSSDAVISAYGQWIGNRYKGYSNIIWSIGGDSNTPNISGLKQKMSDLATGIAAGDPNHLITSEECPVGVCGVGSNSTLDIWHGASWVGLNGDYSQYGQAQAQCAAQYALLTTYPTVPPFQIEDWYEGEHSLTELQLREEGYWEVLSGCYLGRYFGNNAIWTMGGPKDVINMTWQSQLSSTGSLQQALLGSLFRSREHWKMVPDANNTVLTAGHGSGTTISVASRTSDGQTIIAYIPNGNATMVTINMTKITSNTNTVHGWWFNPQTGATMDLGSSFTNTGSMMFTPPDSNDWVLVLDDAFAALPAPGSKDLN